MIQRAVNGDTFFTDRVVSRVDFSLCDFSELLQSLLARSAKIRVAMKGQGGSFIVLFKDFDFGQNFRT